MKIINQFEFTASLPKIGTSIGQFDASDHGRQGSDQGQLIDNQKTATYLTITNELLLQQATAAARTTTIATIYAYDEQMINYKCL